MKNLLKRIEVLERNARSTTSNRGRIREQRAREIQKRTGQNFAACLMQAAGELNLPFTIPEIDAIIASVSPEDLEKPIDYEKMEKLGWPYSDTPVYNLPRGS